MRIGWIQISSRKYGEGFYEEPLKKILAEKFDLELININSKYFKKGYLRAPEILFNLLKISGKKDLWMRDSKTIITLPFDRIQGKNIALIHHIDFSQTKFPFKIIDLFLEKLLYYGLKKADIIVTVSNYWKKHFLEKGYRNVQRVYNCFDLSGFNISDEEVSEFKKKYQLEGKPIIYLGNCQKAKGVLESWEALKDLDVYLVTSGEPMVKTQSLNLEIEHKDYLRLLKASSIVVIMSKLKEGWSRISHEAMLLRTPVIGSGRGGMKELLEGGKQIVCPDFSSLKEKVEYLLNHPEAREKMGEQGYNFAKEFTIEKFKEDWLKVVNQISLNY